MSRILRKLDELIDAKGNESLMDYDPDDRDQRLTALGIMISVWSEWDGIEIMKAFAEALEDANFHDECGIVRDWIDKEGKADNA